MWSLILTWRQHHRIPSCHALSPLLLNGAKTLLALYSWWERAIFSKFHLAACLWEWIVYSRESITCMPEIRGNNCAGLLLQVQASAQFWEVESKKKSDNKSRLPWCESFKWNGVNEQIGKTWELRSIIPPPLLQARKSQISLLSALLWHGNWNLTPWRMNFPWRILFLLAILCSGHIYFSSPAGLIGISQDPRIPDESLLDSFVPAATARRTAARRNNPAVPLLMCHLSILSLGAGPTCQHDLLCFCLLPPES